MSVIAHVRVGVGGARSRSSFGTGRARRILAGTALCAMAAAVAPVVGVEGDPELISVDFVVGPTAGNGTGPCSGDTTTNGTIMNNAVGLVYSNQAGTWNPLNIGTYNQSTASSGFLANGNGAVTTARMVLGLAATNDSTAAGGWRCSPNEGTANTIFQLRNETAYLYNGVITGDHYAWAFTGLTPNAIYQLTLFGGSGNTNEASNVVNGVAGIRDSEGDWNWTSLMADSSGTILGIFTAPNPTLGLYGAQLKHIPRTQPPQSSPSAPVPADGAVSVPTWPTLSWSNCTAAESYDVYLWPSSTAQPAQPTATVTVNQYALMSFLLASTNYSWQVIARNPVGVMNGPIWTFTTDDGHPLVATTPSPLNGATNVLVDTVLDWDDSLAANGYQVYIWAGGGSPPATPTATVAASTCALALPLAGNTLYNWQIVSINAHGATTGTVWSFTTGDRYPGYLVPWPQTVNMGAGDFLVTNNARLVAEHVSLLPLAQVMARDFYMAAGLNLTILQGTAQAGDIALRINAALTGETYTVDSTGPVLALSGGNYQAVAWASVTLLQALGSSGTPVKVPQMLILDQPAAPLRTVMWDVARFFHPLENLYELVDLHRMYKVAYLHLFMSADGLFTFGTETSSLAGLRKTNDGTIAYGDSPGFYLPPSGSRVYYTKTELRALVQYARDRGVVIVPEFDTPGWAAFMTGALPAVFCSSNGTTQTHDININYHTAISAMDSLIAELADVFSTAPYIHIGADEVSSSEFQTYPYWSTASVTNNYATGAEALVWYMSHLNARIAAATNPPGGVARSSWAWSAPGTVGKGYDMPTNMVYTAWGYDDGQYASQGGYFVMRAAGGHVAGMGQANNSPPYNRCLLYRPAQGIYNRLTPLWRYIGAPDNIYTDLTPTFLPLTGRENKILGAHIMEWETPYDIEVPAMRLSMPALGEPTWNQGSSPRLNWDNFQIRQAKADQLYQRVMRPVTITCSTQVDPKDICFTAGGLVTMSSPVAGTIRYTIGTDYKNSWFNFPTSNSTAYAGPFALNQSSVISARLFNASGNPLGNPVTRGFYLITPKTHYKYYFTGATPAANFEQGTPLVSSVMGQMVGNASQEDVRFGDTEHRTVYVGALNIVTAGAYTFSAAYGGALAIDRVALTDGIPVTLTAGEHIFKIVTPASSLGTPYTFSGPGYSAGSDLNVLLKSLSTASQVFPASYGFGSQSLSAGASAPKEFTIINHNVFSNLTITSVQLAGANPGEFVISADSGEAMLAPGAQRIVAVCFNPATAGSKSATLHVVAANLPGGAADATLTGTAVVGTLPAVPSAPAPVDGATGVAVNPTLDWTDASGATSYNVYLWPATGSKPATPNATVAVSQWAPSSNLTDGVSYYWQVVAVNSDGATSGPQWTFHTGTSTVQFNNLANGQVFRYSMVLVDGTFDGGATLAITAAPSATAVSYTTYGTRFRCLADLQPGNNTLTVTDSHGPVAINLALTLPTATNYRFKVWYVVPSDEANAPVDTNWFAHFSLQTKLMQSWMAEDQKRAGNGRKTFYPELDASGNVNVEKLVVSQTRAQATALGTGMYGEVWNQLPAVYKDGLHKNLAFSSVAFNALGAGDLCYVGAYGASGSAYASFHPADATQMMNKLLSTQLGDDHALTYATYIGVTLHETCHCLHQIWHDTTLYNLMGGSGYDISQYFTLTYSAANPAPHGESSAGTLGSQRDLAAWNRYLMSADPVSYSNTTVGVTAGPEYLTATSLYPMAVFYYYIPETAADLHTNLNTSNVTAYTKHAGQARLELRANPYNIMAVDTHGNMSYTSFAAAQVPVVLVADNYTVASGTNVIAAPGVLGNDVNPSGSTLVAALATNVQHGTLLLGANGGFTYIPVVDFVGTDSFVYAVNDGVSSDQTALVTLTVLSAQLTAPANPLPATGATNVLVNTALDWADVGGATSYDVYLWPSAASKPASPTANVTTSYYVPSASLAGAVAYSWQVIVRSANNSSTGAVWTFTTQPLAANPGSLISVDFIYSGASGSTPCIGDTSVASTSIVRNATGLIFTGQTGAWNGLVVGANNANTSSASLTNLVNGTGAVTAASLRLGTATRAGASGGNWRNNYIASFVAGSLRQEQTYIYYPTLTANHINWEFGGLTPNAHYQLAIFGNCDSTFSNGANGVVGALDAEGDWNWWDIQADASGYISGNLLYTQSNNNTLGIYGAQLYQLPAATATTLISTPAVTGIYGTTVVFTATVAPAAPGTVIFKEGVTTLGTGTLSSGVATFTPSVAALAVGLHTVTAYYGGSGSFAASVSAAYDYTVTAKSLTVTGAEVASKVYDGTTAASISGTMTLNGLVGSDVVYLNNTSGGTFADPNVGTGKSVSSAMTISGAAAAKYTLTQPTLTADIIARPVQLGGTRVYDGTTNAAATNLTILNNLDGTNPTLSGSATLMNKDVGAQALAFATAQAPTRVQRGVSAVNNVTTYSVTLATPTNGNTLVAVLATRGTSTNRVTGINQTGATWVRAAQAANSNGVTTELWYAPNVTNAGTTVTISNAAQMRAAAVIIEYSGLLTAGALDQTTSATGSGTTAVTGTTPATIQAGELWIGAIAYSNSTPTLGSILNSFSSVTNAQSTSGTAANNVKVYALERLVTATGTAATTGTISSASQWAGAIATFKAATASTLTLGGSAARNYTLAGATGTVRIMAKALTVTGLTASNKVYDATTAAPLGGTAALQSGEAPGTGSTNDGVPYTGDTLAVTGTATGTFASKQVGTNKTVTVTGNTLGGAQAGNYTLSQQAGLVANIASLPVTVTAMAVTKVYDGTTTAAGTPTITPPLASGDSTTTLAQAFQEPNAGAGNKVLIPSIVISDGNNGANYAVTLQNCATGTITRAPATVQIGSLSATYDGAPKSATVTTTPSNLACSVTYDGSAAAPTNAGNYAVLAVVTASNYQGSADGTLNIAQADQTITFGPLPGHTVGDAPFGLTATASSGLPVSYTSSNAKSVAMVSGSNVTILAAGITVITASQPGDVNYLAAAPVAQTLTVQQPVPVPPTGLVALGTDAQVNLTWNTATNAAGYRVKRALESNAVYLVIGQPATTGYADAPLTNGVLYWYVVAATNEAGTSADSKTVSARPLPPVAPTPWLSAGDVAGFSVDAGAGAVFQVDAMGGIQYRLWYVEALVGAPTNWPWVTPPTDGWVTAPTNGPLLLTDPAAANHPQRFYRIEAQRP